MSKIHLSIVVPAYNEQAGIKEFHQLLSHELKSVGEVYEIIYVDDGSHDNTLKNLHDIAKADKAVRVISFARNFGKEMATTAGIEHAKGEAIIIMDGDGEHPPPLINDLIEKWRGGAQVVTGVRRSRQREGVVKKLGSKVFYRMLNSYVNNTMVPGSTDYRLISRDVQTEFLKFSERHRITRGLIDWLGFKQDYVYFDCPERIAGKATYGTSKLVKLAVNSFVSLSLKPLFVFGWIGIIITVLSLLFGLFMLVEQFFLGDPLGLRFTGSALLGILISFLVGLVLSSQGIIAIYLSHVHGQTQGRPMYVVDQRNSIRVKE